MNANDLVDEMLDARARRRTVVAPSAAGTDLSWEDAYAIGARLSERRVATGERSAGYKIGFTNTVVWTAMGLVEPLFAPLYHETIVDPTRASIDAMVAPRIEPELVLGLAGGELAWFALGFELVQCHYANWAFAPTDAVVDFGLHGALAIGERHAYAPHLDATLGAFTIDLARDGEIVERGSATDVLGSPLNALAWLRDALERRNFPLANDAIVTTGSMTAAPFVRHGETWSVRARGLDLPELRVVL